MYEEIVDKLNTLQRYSLEWDNGGYMSSQYMTEDNCGDWIQVEDIAELFGLKFGYIKPHNAYGFYTK